MEKSQAFTTTASFQTSGWPVAGKIHAAEVTFTERAATPTSFQTSEVSVGGKAEPAEVTVTEGTATPRSFQTSEGSLVEKALAVDNVPYLKGLRLHFLSLRLAPLENSFCFANDPLAWPFCSSLSTSKSRSSGRP